MIFIAYYDVALRPFRKFSLFAQVLLGGVGGTFAYYSALKLGSFTVYPDKIIAFVSFIFVSWAVFFPLSLRVYFMKSFNMKSFKKYILDKLVVTSFDRSGFKRHAKEFDDFENLRDERYGKILSSKKALVTGGSSGIGESTLSTLSFLGTQVNFIGRNIEKGSKIESKYPNSKFNSIDMSNWSGIEEFTSNCDFYDYVVLNAGGMPESKTLNKMGVELQCASQLIGHYLLLQSLKKKSKINTQTRIVWVSSGGMYLKKLDLENLIVPSDYYKVDVYANVKRAQVTLVEELAKSMEWGDYQIFSMHPGWVNTHGLKEALPVFSKLMRNRLRSAYQGADTIVWLLITQKPLSAGSFYFDRRIVSPYMSRGYNPSIESRLELMSMVKSYK